jgi:hypothetical protein
VSINYLKIDKLAIFGFKFVTTLTEPYMCESIQIKLMDYF